MEKEIWKKHPKYTGIEVSTFGRVRTLDRVISSEKYTRFVKGRILKQQYSRGYVHVNIKVDGKFITKSVHRLVAQTFIPNPNNLQQVNHKDCDRANNNVDNLEWCTREENIAYREKFGKALNRPVFAINLTTLEVSRFRSQREASRELGVYQSSINKVLKGTQKTAHGYWFKEDDGNGIEIEKDKLNDIADSIPFTGGIFAVNLNTLEVLHFRSQGEASRVLGIYQASISNVIKGKRKQTNGYWLVNDDGHAVDVVKSKLHDIGGTGLKIKQGR